MEDGLGAANVTVHELAWGDRKPAKPNRILFTAWVGPTGRLAAISPGPASARLLRAFAFGEKELTVARDHKIATRIGTSRDPRPSRDGRQRFHPRAEVDLDASGATVTRRKPPAPRIAGARDPLFATTREYLASDGKPAGQFGFALRGADAPPGGGAAWVMDEPRRSW